MIQEEGQVAEFSAEKPKKKKWKKRLLIVSGVFGFLILTATILGYIYEDDLKKEILQKINEELKNPIVVSDINLSFIKNFPNASLTFNDLIIKEKNDIDTILYTPSFTLKLNPFKLISGDYVIKSISINKPKLNLRIDKKGKAHYVFWKTNTVDTTAISSSSTQVNIKNIQISDLSLNYLDESQNFSLKTYEQDVQMKLNLNDAKTEIKVENKAMLSYLQKGVSKVFRDKALDLSLEMEINDDKINLPDGKLSIGDFNINLKGESDFDFSTYNFDLNAQKVNLPEFISLLPNYISENIENYDFEGSFNLNGYIKANQSKPEIQLKINSEQAKVTEKNTEIALHDIGLDAQYSLKNEYQKLIVEKCGAILNNSKIDLSSTASGKDWINIEGKVSGDIQLDDLNNFLHLPNIENLEGNLSLKTSYKAAYSLKTKKASISKLEGNINASKTNLKLENYPQITDIDANLKLGQSSSFTFSANTNNSDLKVNAQIQNLLPHIISNKNSLSANVYVQSQSLDLREWMVNSKSAAKRKKESSGSEESNATSSVFDLSFFDSRNITINTNIQHLTTPELDFKNTLALIQTAYRKVELKNLQTQSEIAHIKLNANLYQNNDTNFLIALNGDLNNLNLKKSFQFFKDFDQDILTQKHIGGLVNAKIYQKIYFNHLNQIDSKKLYANVKYEIINGELNNFPLLEYMGENMITKMLIDVDYLKPKLKNIKFEKIEHQISLQNQVIDIPLVTVKSSALEHGITTYGTYNFNDSIDFGLSFLYNEITKRKRDTEFGQIQTSEDSKRLYLHINGTTEDYDFKLSDKKLKEYFKSERKEENGSFFDNIFGKPNEKENTGKTSIEFEEDKPKETKPQKENNEKKDDKKIEIEFEE